jgi:argininosuccinate lyase
MENTGRIQSGISQTVRRILFGETADSSIQAEMMHASQIDKAHVVMLAEQGIINRKRACELLEEIQSLRALNFEPLMGRLAPRGVYLLYENYLIEKLGDDTGGILQTARSRNDLNATILQLRMRRPVLRLMTAASRLQSSLLFRARQYAEVVCPAYTHYQAAVPITYGHYLAGIATALERDISGLWDASRGLGLCPLGAGAVGGTSFPIDTSRTAHLLGFDRPTMHSVDAVASRDQVLRVLAATSILGITLSRLSADLLLWLTAEFGFLTLPDHLVGSSSLMPQKRNPFILEHVQGRSAVATGALVAALTAMQGKPFTNSIAVGTEAVSPLWKALESIEQAIILVRLVMSGAQPEPSAMMKRARDGYSAATEFANRLVIDKQMSFRKAHHVVGAIIREGIEEGEESLQELANRWHSKQGPPDSPPDLDPTSVAQKTVYGGGPGRSSLESCLRALEAGLSERASRRRELRRKWRSSDEALDKAVAQLLSGARN